MVRGGWGEEFGGGKVGEVEMVAGNFDGGEGRGGEGEGEGGEP